MNQRNELNNLEKMYDFLVSNLNPVSTNYGNCKHLFDESKRYLETNFACETNVINPLKKLKEYLPSREVNDLISKARDIIQGKDVKLKEIILNPNKPLFLNKPITL